MTELGCALEWIVCTDENMGARIGKDSGACAQ
jgi:hypothetical protein